MIQALNAVTNLHTATSFHGPSARRRSGSRLRSGSGGRASLSDAEERVGVAELEVTEDVQVCIIEQLLQHCRGLLGRISRENKCRCTRDMRASHGCTALRGSGAVG